ncbi:MAG TPA: Kdo hydroxylase family protein [Terriglobia bacterium]|nr:Kdo hydroxylase family protein [Terriglobia bacterium]
MGLIAVNDYSIGGWAEAQQAEARARWYCERLEDGEILCFSSPPFELPERDRAFLIGVRQTGSAHHKNISYKPGRDRVSGLSGSAAYKRELQRVMRSYSQRAIDFLGKFLIPYAGRWRLDFASFRSIEEEGRALPARMRNDLLHVDSFPTRPSNGDRILRVFTNLHPSRARVWLISEPFPLLAVRYGNAAGAGMLAEKYRSPWRPVKRSILRFARRLGVPVIDRPLYDEFMLGFHHYLKANTGFQRESPKLKWEFPPNSTWLVFTDTVPHAVISGQFALEQTVIVRREALIIPEKAPYRILQNMAGVPVVD